MEERTLELFDTDVVLEAVIDDVGIHVLLAKLANVCLDKADHMRAIEGDVAMARTWVTRAKKLSTLSLKI